ncbi:MAG: hypothetical protein VB045_00285, partial [Synergistaceae bacterium]|nr:hypothetical protein [Synergistaceae bacterium]
GALPTCKIVAPANFSGTVDFDVRAVTTEDDGHSLTGPLVPVSGTITPSPEAEMVTSTVADEDTLTKLNFDIQQRNGDADEEITSVSVRISEMEGHGFSLFLGNSGTTLATAAGQAGSGVTIDGDFYKISGTARGNIWAKGDPNSSGEHAFDIRYEVTDPSSDGTLPTVASTTNGTYTLTVNSVTDDTTSTLTNLTASNGNAVISGSTVTASGTTTISMDVVVQQASDLQAGNTPDTDGSEHLLRFVIDGVPDGVTVQGGVYIGDTPGNPNTGQWLVDVSPDQAFAGSGTLTQTLVFQLDGTADFLSDLNQTITVTAVTQDGESAGEMISGASFTILTPSDFNASMPSADVPAVITEAEFTPLAPGALEDGGMNLNDLVDFELTGSSPFSITLTGIPAGSAVSGMIMTIVNGEEIWTASGSGGDGALQALLSGITITPPENWNDNNHPGGLTFEAKLTTYTPSGAQNNAQVDIVQPVGPISDATEISISAPEGSEDSSVDLTISLANAADGAFNTIVDGKLYISLNQAALDSGGKLYYEGVEVTSQTVSGVTGIPNGTYYVLSGVDSGDSLALTYQPGANWSGNVTLTAGLLTTETEASNVLSATETVNFSIAPVNDGATVSALSPATGAEDTKIELALQGTLVDADGSESILSAVIGNLPDGYLVFAGADAGSAVLATNLGDDGAGNSWAIGLTTGGDLPAYVAILPPEHVSGQVGGLTFSVLSGEAGLDPVENTTTFDLTVTPVADGITLNPTLSFGTEGQGIHLNLNSSMLDTDGSETVSLTLKGLGDHASFSVGSGSTFTTLYDTATDTYTLKGIEADHIDNLSVIQSAGNYNNIQVSAWTVESDDSQSAIVTDTFNLNISETIPTPGNDLLLYRTGRSFDGREGTDTLMLRPGEDIDFSSNPVIRNMEIIDLNQNGDNHILDNLSIQDVLNITDGNNLLTILGGTGDKVNLVNEGTDSWQKSGVFVDGGITFDVYTSIMTPDVTLRIQQEIDDNIV